jgi:homoserine/homoserine lactone efflux protein
MTWQILALFTVTETVLCLTPGPAVLLVLSQALARGFRASVCSTLGILAGNILYFALSATSLGALLVASYTLFFAIKWIGAAYLVWLGISAFRGQSAMFSARPDAGPRHGACRMFVNGFVLQTANPKALVFFSALLPQFVDPTLAVAPQLLVLGGLSVIIESAVLLSYGALAGRASGLAMQPRFARLTNRLSGGALVTAGVGLAMIRA